MSTAHFKNVAVVGAGGIGEYILNALLEKKSHFDSITVIVRASSQNPLIDTFSQQGVRVVRVSFDDHDELVKALRGIDVVVSAVGPTALGEPQLALIRAAKEAGVRRILPSEYGLDTTLPEVQDSAFFSGKIRALKAIKEAGLEYTLVVVGFFPDYFLNLQDFSQIDVVNHVAEFVGDGNTPIAWTHRIDVGKYVVATLLNPEVSRNTAVFVAGEEHATLRELVAILEKKTGHSFTVRSTDVEETRKTIQPSLDKGDHLSYVKATLLTALDDGLVDLTGKLDNAKYPDVRPWSLEESVQHWLSNRKQK